MNNKNEKIRVQLENMTTAELQERRSLRWLSRNDADEDYFDLVEEVLRARGEDCGRAPVWTDPEASWDAMMVKFKAEVDAGNAAALAAGNTAKTGRAGRKRRTQRPVLRRVAAVAAVAAALALTLGVAQAAGVDVFGAIGRWTESVFHFERRPETTGDLDVELMQVDESTVLPELREAFAACEIPLSLAPKNVPEDMTVTEVELIENADIATVSFLIGLGDDSICQVSVLKYKEDVLELNSYEKSEDSPIEYVHNNKCFYIFQNAETLQAVWADGNYEITVYGDVTEVTIQEILNLF